ncbi:MAG TPA: cell envelope integrity protein TolA, partial [Eoetvoesiella sp.]
EKKAQEQAAAKKAKELAAKEAAEKAEAEKAAEQKALAAKAAAEQKAKEQASAKKAAAEKAAKEQAAKEVAAKKAAEEKAASDKKAKEAAAAKAAADKAAAAKREAIKQAMRGDALGAAGIPGGTADRNQSGGGGNDNGYAAQVRACIRPRVAYPVPPRTGSSNPTVQYRANLSAEGLVTSVQIQRSSGIAGFDRAVTTGIQGCAKFPKPPSGKYPAYVDGNYRMYD